MKKKLKLSHSQDADLDHPKETKIQSWPDKKNIKEFVDEYLSKKIENETIN